MNIKIIPINFLSIKTLKMMKKDIPIVLQNINMSGRHFFLLFKSLRLSGTTLVFLKPVYLYNFCKGTKLVFSKHVIFIVHD